MPTPDRLLEYVRRVGVASSASIQAELGISQATASRMLAPLLASSQLLRVGRGRHQQYLAPGQVPGVELGAAIPITRIDAQGRAEPFASLVPVSGGRFWVEEASGPQGLHDGLPWFLADMRPQGFTGRTFARAHPALNLAANPEHWSEADVLRALCAAGEDLPGNLVIGAASFERWQQLSSSRSTAADYPRLAEQALQGTPAGSSAGGDQPKFGTTDPAGRALLVKFSPAGEAPADARWRDLLVCEHLALATLADGGVPAACSTIEQAGGRVFLAVERFDRTAAGRVGMVSLLAYDSEYIGHLDNWASTADRMAARGLLTEADAARLQLLEAFGILIGNTDRHYGNVSLLMEDGRWVLAPAYDMLPMVYAPTAGELVDRNFDPAKAIVPAHALRQWPTARRLACAFWQRVQGDERIGAQFRQRAAAHAEALRD